MLGFFNIKLNKYYFYLLYTSYFLYALLFFGVLHDVYYINLVSKLTQIFIALFLIIRFNPFSKTIFTKIDKKIAFHAGILLFSTNTIITIYYKLYDLKNSFKQYIF